MYHKQSVTGWQADEQTYDEEVKAHWYRKNTRFKVTQGFWIRIKHFYFENETQE